MYFADFYTIDKMSNDNDLNIKRVEKLADNNYIPLLWFFVKCNLQILQKKKLKTIVTLYRYKLQTKDGENIYVVDGNNYLNPAVSVSIPEEFNDIEDAQMFLYLLDDSGGIVLTNQLDKTLYIGYSRN